MCPRHGKKRMKQGNIQSLGIRCSLQCGKNTPTSPPGPVCCCHQTTTRVAQPGPAVALAHLTASSPLGWQEPYPGIPAALPGFLSRAEGTHHSALGEGSGRRCSKCHCASAALHSWASSAGLGSSPPGKESFPG